MQFITAESFNLGVWMAFLFFNSFVFKCFAIVDSSKAWLLNANRTLTSSRPLCRRVHSGRFCPVDCTIYWWWLRPTTWWKWGLWSRRNWTGRNGWSQWAIPSRIVWRFRPRIPPGCPGIFCTFARIGWTSLHTRFWPPQDGDGTRAPLQMAFFRWGFLEEISLFEKINSIWMMTEAQVGYVQSGEPQISR